MMLTFPDTAPTYKHQVGPAPDEIAGGQLFDLQAVEGLGIELPVEGLQGFALRETRLPDATLHRVFMPRCSRRPQELIEEAEQREALLLGLGEESIQCLRLKQDAQSLEVVQAAVM